MQQHIRTGLLALAVLALWYGAWGINRPRHINTSVNSVIGGHVLRGTGTFTHTDIQ
jgi:hypothetical protein